MNKLDGCITEREDYTLLEKNGCKINPNKNKLK